MKKQDFEACKSLLFLTWADCHERLDYLLVELRHLQENILYMLKEPKLYEILEHEQTYFHPSKYAADLSEKYAKTEIEINDEYNPAYAMDDTTYAIRRFVEEAILYFPAVDVGEGGDFDKCKLDYYKDKKQICEVRDVVLKACRRLWTDHSWNSEQKKHYYLLRACQSVKQSLFEDKLWLVHYAKDLFSDLCDKEQPDKDYRIDLRKFLACRAAVKDRMGCYVHRLGEMQSVLKGSLDIGLHDHTRPLVERYKEQNIFNRFLAQHCVTLQRQLNQVAAKMEGDIKAGNKHQVGTINIHCSDFDATSHYHPTNASRERYYFGRDSVHSILTSFWMPERPDLIPVIAHEAAHSTHHRFWGGIPKFIDKGSPFRRTMLVLERLTVDHDIYRELAIDMLALMVQGPAYLYALFLELFCHGEEKVFSRDKLSVDLSMSEEDAFESLNDIKYVDRQWYVRVQVACRWMEMLLDGDVVGFYEDPEGLIGRLIASIKALSEDYLYGVELALNEEYQSRCNLHRVQLSKLTEGIITILDDYFSKSDFDFSDVKSILVAEVSPMSLDKEVSTFLCRGLIRRKVGKLAERKELSKEEQSAHFKNVYGLDCQPDCTGDGACGDCAKINLFRQLQDIPWECSLLRGLDSMHSRSHLKQRTIKEVLISMKDDLSLGREFYQVAIDFQLSATAQPYTIMSDIVRALSSFRQQYANEAEIEVDMESLKKRQPQGAETEPEEEGQVQKPIKELIEVENISLKKWLTQGAETELEEEGQVQKLIKELEKVDAGHEVVNKYSASVIGNAFVYTNDTVILKKLSDLYCYKLVDLHRLIGVVMEALGGGDAKPPEGCVAALRVIRNVLETHYDSSQADIPLDVSSYRKKMRKEYLTTIFKAFSTPSDGRCSEPYPQDVFSIGRLCMSSVHLLDKMDAPLCFASSKRKGKVDPELSSSRFFPLLGRYDHFVVNKTRPLYRNTVIAQDLGGDKRSYVPYFVRWESAVPLMLPKETNGKTRQPTIDGDIVGLLSVSMDRTELRLDMVHRLMKVFKSEKKAEEGYFESLGNLLDQDWDRVFLSDGWGDFLLIFCVESKENTEDVKKRLKDIFEIQNSLYQDFLVERTELILTPRCFDEAVRDYENYRCSIHMRLQEDKSVLPGNKLFVESAAARLGELGGTGYFTFTKTPGRFDFFCRFKRLPEDISKLDGSLYTKITTALLKPYGNDPEPSPFRIKVDKLQTNVKKLEYPKGNEQSGRVGGAGRKN